MRHNRCKCSMGCSSCAHKRALSSAQLMAYLKEFHKTHDSMRFEKRFSVFCHQGYIVQSFDSKLGAGGKLQSLDCANELCVTL